MPSKPEGVYKDGRGGWYVKVTVGRDPLTGRRAQITRRGFKTAADAGRARRDLVAQADRGQLRASSSGELTLVWLSPSIERVGKVSGWFEESVFGGV